MTVSVELRELLDYSDHERRRWRDWIAGDPARLEIPFQSGGRFPSVGSLLDHVFLVERRHLARLQGGTPPESTGVQPGDWIALFDYGALVRADFRRYVADLDEDEARATIAVAARSGTQSMTKRRLVTHILLHEVRHLAQIAYAARLASHEPPGQHDLFYFPGP